MTTRAVAILAALSTLTALPSLAAGQSLGSHGATSASSPPEESRTLRATPLPPGSEIRIDGRLDEALWNRAPVASGFVQQSPNPGAPASESTEVRVVRSDDAIYIAARLHDAAPDSIRASMGRRDDAVRSDWFYVWIDGFDAGLSGHGFGVSAAGVQRDLTIHDDYSRDQSWDGVWASAVSRTAQGWVAELRIPLSQLRFDASGDRWGINFSREIARRDEVSFWSETPPGESRFVSRFGGLSGVEGLEPGLSLEVSPYLTTRMTRLPSGATGPLVEQQSVRSTVGADLQARLTTSLTLSATINPDFGQVEADPARINLSAFETFQSERRPFFVEGSDFFSLTFPTWPPTFYSRRIGRSPQVGAPTDAEASVMPEASTILGAMKLTGRTSGGWSIGLVDAVTQREEVRYLDATGEAKSRTAEPWTNYAAARVARDFQEGRSGLGILLTSTDRFPGDDTHLSKLHRSARTLAFDGWHRFADDRWELRAGWVGARVTGDSAAIVRTQLAPGHYFARPDAGHVHFDPDRRSLAGWSFAGRLQKIAGNWRTGVYTKATSPGYENSDLGFNPTLDNIRVSSWLRYEEYDPGAHLRSWRANLSLRAATNFEGVREAWTQSASLDGTLLNGWGGHIGVTRAASAWEPFALRGGPSLRKPGSWTALLRLRSDIRHDLRGNASLFWRSEDGTEGRTLDLRSGLSVRTSPRLDLTASPSLHWSTDAWQYLGRRTLDGSTEPLYLVGQLERRIASLSLRADYAATPELTFQLHLRPYLAAGEYTAVREVVDPGAADFADRFRTHTAHQARGPDGDWSLDRDDGSTLGRSNPDFNSRSLQVNTVLRWQYRPGSTLFLVWSHDRAAFDRAAFSLHDDLDALWSASGRNVLQVKATWWAGW